jgi:two-component system OmpR family response regulator
MKVLVVEDDEGAAGFVAAGLAARGHQPTVARDGREGYLRASADRFDLIVLDRMLPKLDGLGVVGHCHINRFYCSLLASPLDSDSINSMA